jgi:hypothetical protein
VGASATSRPNVVAAATDTDMARTRPTRSATIDHGITETARPVVASDTVKAASAAPMR